jgi:tRNA pseudouridine55 synthase
LPDGLLVIDKPEGPTSHDVVARVRRVLGERRVGHTGTLDPLATGVLPLVLGRATRLAQFLTAEDKRYIAEIRFGQATTTYDREGDPVGPVQRPSGLTREAVDAALRRFRGTFRQTPPPYSAKKVGGVSAHRLARRGAAPTLEPVVVTVHDLALLDFADAEARVELRCSAGFYVRSLAHDLGAALGCGGHLRSLRRTASGSTTLRGAVSLATVEAEPETVRAAIQPLSSLLPTWPAIRVTTRGADKVRQGALLGPADCESGDIAVALAGAAASQPVCVRVLDPRGQLLGLAGWAAAGGNERAWPAPHAIRDDIPVGSLLLHPRIVLV